MADVHTKAQRSFNMSQIRDKNTKPELLVRSLVHRMGYRFRLHRKDLPGKPDMVFAGCKKIIFVHGCFWHVHGCKYGRVRPQTNAEFWQDKRAGNKVRDRKNLKALKILGWDVLVVWQCQTRNLGRLAARLNDFLSGFLRPLKGSPKAKSLGPQKSSPSLKIITPHKV